MPNIIRVFVLSTAMLIMQSCGEPLTRQHPDVCGRMIDDASLESDVKDELHRFCASMPCSCYLGPCIEMATGSVVSCTIWSRSIGCPPLRVDCYPGRACIIAMNR